MYRERERERDRCLLCVTAAACGEEEDERSLSLRLLDCVFLSYSGIVYSLWAVVVFPTIVGFPRYILCLHIISVFCVYFVHTFSISVVAERTSGTNLNRKYMKLFKKQLRNG